VGYGDCHSDVICIGRGPLSGSAISLSHEYKWEVPPPLWKTLLLYTVCGFPKDQYSYAQGHALLCLITTVATPGARNERRKM
jgi:hypothetical protein